MAVRDVASHRIDEGEPSRRSVNTSRPRALFICGSINQTTQLHQIARELPELDATYIPYYCDGILEVLRRLGALNFTILGSS
jgi:hypothetical protein